MARRRPRACYARTARSVQERTFEDRDQEWPCAGLDPLIRYLFTYSVSPEICGAQPSELNFADNQFVGNGLVQFVGNGLVRTGRPTPGAEDSTIVTLDRSSKVNNNLIQNNDFGAAWIVSIYNASTGFRNGGGNNCSNSYPINTFGGDVRWSVSPELFVAVCLLRFHLSGFSAGFASS